MNTKHVGAYYNMFSGALTIKKVLLVFLIGILLYKLGEH